MTHDNTWSGLISVDDTALWTIDSGGPGVPVVYLNGSFSDLKHWDPVIGSLSDRPRRHVRFDERARGRRSRTSSDYSFEAAIRDVTAVLDARGIRRAILVGWSYGAVLAMNVAARHPERVAGIVSVDGAMPIADEMFNEELEARIHKLFRSMRWMFPVARRLGLAARISAEGHAEVNLDVLRYQTHASLDPVVDQVECPVRYVVGEGGHRGTNAQEMAQVRAGLGAVLERRPNFQITARVPVNHEKIVRKGFSQIADAVREVEAAVGRPAERRPREGAH